MFNGPRDDNDYPYHCHHVDRTNCVVLPQLRWTAVACVLPAPRGWRLPEESEHEVGGVEALGRRPELCPRQHHRRARPGVAPADHGVESHGGSVATPAPPPTDRRGHRVVDPGPRRAPVEPGPGSQVLLGPDHRHPGPAVGSTPTAARGRIHCRGTGAATGWGRPAGIRGAPPVGRCGGPVHRQGLGHVAEPGRRRRPRCRGAPAPGAEHGGPCGGDRVGGGCGRAAGDQGGCRQHQRQVPSEDPARPEGRPGTMPGYE